jgi:hypothetical protein
MRTDIDFCGNLLRISRPLLHCCNTPLAIGDESSLRARSSLVIRVTADQDKITNNDPASNRQEAGQDGRVD